mmetsp:Transcript_11974/g.17852  ORF Transcript_11974/g.17852 Transcript_11974/m.17852 type:complete len:171 (-) Transcript_11974:108-620(-)|eukprot:CAMPEP_0167760398 /NCGR_PEP_ID=MMETSP0110_2-20121227/11566_1 /TAXON_ID=629695 /ORGANISM="Gymnochlora sp., Strain CCMP2014" /LENGTH=170 /DNA_ID=CAMNT_0007646909 /DNA_START=88 /DNA_END=600 /DNA_ORIENTATION=+
MRRHGYKILPSFVLFLGIFLLFLELHFGVPDLTKGKSRKRRRLVVQRRGLRGYEKKTKRKIDQSKNTKSTFDPMNQKPKVKKHVPLDELLLGGELNKADVNETDDSEDSYYREVKMFTRKKRVDQLRGRVHVGAQVLKNLTGDYMTNQEQESANLVRQSVFAGGFPASLK